MGFAVTDAVSSTVVVVLIPRRLSFVVLTVEESSSASYSGPKCSQLTNSLQSILEAAEVVGGGGGGLGEALGKVLTGRS